MPRLNPPTRSGHADTHVGLPRLSVAFPQPPNKKGTMPSGSGRRGWAWENSAGSLGSFSQQEAGSRITDRLTVGKSQCPCQLTAEAAEDMPRGSDLPDAAC